MFIEIKSPPLFIMIFDVERVIHVAPPAASFFFVHTFNIIKQRSRRFKEEKYLEILSLNLFDKLLSFSKSNPFFIFDCKYFFDIYKTCLKIKKATVIKCCCWESPFPAVAFRLPSKITIKRTSKNIAPFILQIKKTNLYIILILKSLIKSKNFPHYHSLLIIRVNSAYIKAHNWLSKLRLIDGNRLYYKLHIIIRF